MNADAGTLSLPGTEMAAGDAERLPRAQALCDLPSGGAARVLRVVPRTPEDAIARRLCELGFVDGERVRIVAVGPVGADPLLVQVGYTRFALRRAEAARVIVEAAR